jgi:hypothetical protein
VVGWGGESREDVELAVAGSRQWLTVGAEVTTVRSERTERTTHDLENEASPF